MALIAMFVLVFFNVIGRYFFSFSVIWVDELARYLIEEKEAAQTKYIKETGLLLQGLSKYNRI